ncbi:class I SAM-dependent DNA methyltransferase [Streptosporangium sp. NPDC049376]|uniref:class I SAM-dependent DNA methyltransferase n=1 Tax=Streptosporangium sp. NPDC049376 TaxID=3366192 RepID=UPI003792A614
MPDSADLSVSVTLAEIARIAGVGRAAVSNWRRRHESFPAPVGGTDTSPQFALSQVEGWLRDHNKIGEVGSRERLWPEFEALGNRDAMGAAIAVAGARLATAEKPATGTKPPDAGPLEAELSRTQRDLVDRAVGLARKHGAYDVFDFLLGRWLDTHVRQISATPQPLADLMAELAEVSCEGWCDDGARTVLDPACGTGGILLAAARRWADPADTRDPGSRLRLLGQDSDPIQAALADVRLLLAGQAAGQDTPRKAAWESDVRPGNTLRVDPHPDVRADVVLCNPPFNERDWGYEELATDPRWTYGLPPRTESELAWVQHALARLTPGGTAVVLLPPAVASRKAGRRIRAALLRAGVLRAVVALPPGCAPPHSVALHLWVLRAPETGGVDPGVEVLMVDAANVQPEAGDGTQRGGRAGIDWSLLRRSVISTVLAGGEGEGGPCGYASVPVIDLLDDEVDLTPARHVPKASTSAGPGLRRSWDRFDALLDELRDLTTTLSKLEVSTEAGAAQGTVTVGDLVRAGAVTLRAGQQPADDTMRTGDAPADAVAVLTVPDVAAGGRAAGWLSQREASAGEESGGLTVTTPDEVVVVGSYRAFTAWVDVEAPTVLGPQLFALRVDPALLDPWFLAGCLRAPANARRAGTHASTSSRVDVRRLQVLRLPLREQRVYGEVFRRLSVFERSLREAGAVGRELVNGLTDGLSAGRLPHAPA